MIDNELPEAIDTLDPQGPTGYAINPDSPSGTGTYSNKKQIEANYLSRSIENARFLGAGAQAAYFEAAIYNSNELSSDEVTEDVQIGNVIGNGAGLIFGILLHYSIRKHYRTGEYTLKTRPTPPAVEELAQLKTNDILIYQEQGKLSYVVKKSLGKPILEQIDLEKIYSDSDGELDPDEYQDLKELLAELCNGGTPIFSVKRKAAFFKYTSKRGHTYSSRISTNPLYRNFKTLANFGWQLGATISNFIGIQDHNKKRLLSYLMSDLCCIVLGLFAFPYWFIREKILKIPPNTKHKHSLTGNEGWSKYTKTALTFGTALGQAIGGVMVATMSQATAAISSFSIAFWGGIVGVGSFIVALIGVPLINWVSSKFRKDGKGILTSNSPNAYRNNYTRSGMVIGAALGACFGLLIGNWSFGLILAGTIFSAIGSVVGGIALSIYGHKIQVKLHDLPPPGETEASVYIDNSWDYVSRSTASVFGFIGAAVVCAINPAAALLLIPLGAAVASGIGWCLGLLIMLVARDLPDNKREKKADTLPWTQRITTGANIGSIIGSAIGLGIGFAGFVLGGPAGVILAVSLFGAIGAVVGAIVGALYDKQARSLIYEGIASLFRKSPKNAENPSTEGLSPDHALVNSCSCSPSGSSSPLRTSTAKTLKLMPVDINETPLQPNRDVSPPQNEKRNTSAYINGTVMFKVKRVANDAATHHHNLQIPTCS